MSFSNYQAAMKKAEKKKYFFTTGGLDESIIKTSEEILGVHFTGQILDYCKKYGYISFEGCEIFSLAPNDTSGVLTGNSVLYALYERENYNLPKGWIPIFDYTDGTLAFLNYDDVNINNEPCIILAGYNGSEYQKYEKLADDFGDFLLELVTEL